MLFWSHDSSESVQLYSMLVFSKMVPTISSCFKPWRTSSLWGTFASTTMRTAPGVEHSSATFGLYDCMTEAGLISLSCEHRKCSHIISIKSPSLEILQKELQHQKKHIQQAQQLPDGHESPGPGRISHFIWNKLGRLEGRLKQLATLRALWCSMNRVYVQAYVCVGVCFWNKQQ